MKTLPTFKQFLNEDLYKGPGPKEQDTQYFISYMSNGYDVSDIWEDVENGKRYIVIETEGATKKGEAELRADVEAAAKAKGYQYVPDHKTAKKLGIGNAYADDAILVYVGK